MNGMLPFAVVGSMDEVKVGNRMVRARQYPWGTVQVRIRTKEFPSASIMRQEIQWLK